MVTCIECGKPARLLRDVLGFSEHCSNACAIATWNREQAEGRIVCVEGLTPSKLDEALSSGGWGIEGGES